MTKPNYESEWWGLIYDEMMSHLSDWVEHNRRFYLANLRDARGPVLECACGTGIFLLPLLRAGYDTYGFDISTAMLGTLRKKAHAFGIADIDERVSLQSFESFRYERCFDAILIPTNSFRMLTTQEAQIRTLSNIYQHLAPGGKLLLDLRLAGMRELVEAPQGIEGTWYTWTHPETGLPIRQRVVGWYDFNHQQTFDQCYIEYEGQVEDFPITGRWIFKEEFQLLLRLAGFRKWQVYGSPDGEPLELGLDEIFSYWVAEK